ncbi:MAG: hypothetical protein MJB14_07735 [Spirochaetes bacterium]|nr:hypothetical protein [Spirochaetota bacterium]
MKIKYNLLILMIMICVSCYAEKNGEVEWIKKNPLQVHYFIPIKRNEIICYEIGKGYFIINERGKISNKVIFKNDDERKYVSNVKILPDIGNYGILTLSDKEKYIVEIHSEFKLEKVIRVPELNLRDTDFLISSDKKRYCGFWTPINLNGENLPHKWIDIESGKIVSEFKFFSIGNNRVYFVNNKYYDFDSPFFSRYNSEGKEIKPYLSLKKHILINETKKNNFYKINRDDEYILNNSNYSDDGYFYILPNNYLDKKSWSYYLVKLDLELNVIGKRRVDLTKKYGDRCTSSIYVDKDGYIYVASDKEMTITKFKPIKDGEDSHIDLSK